MIINIGNSDVKKYTLTVNTNANAVVNVVKDGSSYSETANSSGKALFSLIAGTWTVTSTLGDSSKTATVEIEADTSIDLFVSMIPSFTYSGTYEIVNDSDQKITMSTDNWKIRFLTGGTLKFTELNGAANGIDIFAVGGGGGGGGGCCNWGTSNQGGGGGGGGQISTKNKVTVDTRSQGYEIRIGAGGTSGNGWGVNGGIGGQTSGFGCTAYGGTGGSGGTGSWDKGAAGGTGTGAGGTSGYYVHAGTNGGNGVRDKTAAYTYYGAGGGGGGGSDYGESKENLSLTNAGYGGRTGGGNGGRDKRGSNGQSNTGSGGGGGSANNGVGLNDDSIFHGGTGGSGILIICNAR